MYELGRWRWNIGRRLVDWSITSLAIVKINSYLLPNNQFDTFNELCLIVNTTTYLSCPDPDSLLPSDMTHICAFNNASLDFDLIRQRGNHTLLNHSFVRTRICSVLELSKLPTLALRLRMLLILQRNLLRQLTLFLFHCHHGSGWDKRIVCAKPSQSANERSSFQPCFTSLELISYGRAEVAQKIHMVYPVISSQQSKRYHSGANHLQQDADKYR
jgi:hypothetical protein